MKSIRLDEELVVGEERDRAWGGSPRWVPHPEKDRLVERVMWWPVIPLRVRGWLMKTFRCRIWVCVHGAGGRTSWGFHRERDARWFAAGVGHGLKPDDGVEIYLERS